jgi:hypothetical protein
MPADDSSMMIDDRSVARIRRSVIVSVEILIVFLENVHGFKNLRTMRDIS